MILKTHLKILNAKELFLKDQLGLVKKIVKAALINFPFQNVSSFGAFLPRERPTPNFKEILMASVTGGGGLCGHLNNFMKYQLESLGYQVELVAGQFRRSSVSGNHFVVKMKIPGYAVKDVRRQSNEDRTYIIDIGSGIPLHEPICLETLPYRGRAGGLDFRYERGDGNTIRRVNECGDALMGKKPSSYESPQDCVIDLKPRHYSDFMEPVHAVYSNPQSNYLHQGFYCSRYLSFSNDGDDCDFKIVCIRGTELLFITKETRESHMFSSVEEIKPSLIKYFPMIPRREVELAVKHFSIPFEEALKMSSKSM